MIESNTMSIVGGILTYYRGRRLNDEIAPYGRKVKFLGKNGRDMELNEALKVFTPGQILTVKEIYVDRNFSEVEFIEVFDRTFNSVMFSDIIEVIDEDKPVFIEKQTADFTVQTPAGKIEVFSSTDPGYPGIYIDINGVQRLLIDHVPDAEEIKIRVWEDEEDPSYVYSISDPQ